MLDCALHYASFGWRVLPLHTIIDGKCSCGDISGACKPGKHPYTPLVPNGSKNATTDESTIRLWFDGSIALNIGICAGEESGLVILDIDPTHGGDEALAALEQKYGPLPQTTEVITGSGGRHFYFKHPGGDIRNSAGTLGTGLDVRGHNGYVVAPPSMHLSGNEYKWKIDPRGLMPVLPPPWLIAAKETTPQSTSEQSDDKITEGNRNDRLYRMACSMRHKGFDQEAIYQALDIFNNKNCSPPLDNKELSNVVQGACKYKPAPPPDDQHIHLPDDNPDTMAEAFEAWSRDTCGVMHRYNQIDGWSLYSNNKYQLVDSEAEIEKYIRDFIRDHVKFKAKRKNDDGTFTTYYAKPDRKQKSAQYVNNIIKWLRDMPGVHLRPGQKAPYSLDGSLNPRNVLAMQNGLLDITNRKKPVLLPFTPDFYTFNYYRFPYDPTRKAPKWLWVLGEYFQDEDGNPDTLVPDILHSRIKKYLLRDTRDHKILAIVGRCRSGKGTIARTIQELLGGERNVATITISILASDFGLQPLLNKQLAIMWDASLAGRNGDTNKAVEILKNISGEDGIQINRKGKPHLNLEKMPINIMVVANKVLDLRDSSGALAGRFTFLETTKSFYGHEDSSIEDQIRDEIPGIFNLILAVPEGEILEHPKSHILQTEFEELSSPYIAFINEWCVIDPDEFIPTNVLWKYYCQWCKRNNHQAPSAQKFKIDFNGVHDGIKRYRPQLTEQQLSNLKLEYNLDARAERDLDVTNRPHCYRGINVDPVVKNIWNQEKNV